MVASIGRSFSGTGFLFQYNYPRFRGAPSGFFKACPQGLPSVDSGLALLRWQREVVGLFAQPSE